MIDLLLPSTVHLLLALLLLMVGAFRSAVPRRRRWRYPLLCAVLWTWLVATPVVPHALAWWMERLYSPIDAPIPADTRAVVLVLASGEAWERSTWERAQLDLASLRRTLAGTALQQASGGTLLFSGGAYHGEPRPVAERMAEVARRAGVPEQSIRTETTSLSTWQNLRNSAGMIDSDTVYLVTSALHMRRAVTAARAAGLTVIPAPCDYRSKYELTWRAWLPDAGTLPLWRLVIHEALATLYYRWRGWT